MILTDRPPEAGSAGWYGLRAWIAQGFTITKRAGWQGQRTHMTKPERAARLWLAVAVATLWLLSIGGEADATIPASTVPDSTTLVPRQPRTRQATCLRRMGAFRRGWNLILVALLDQVPLPRGRMSFYCAYFMQTRTANALQLDPQTLGGIAALGARLELHIYCDRDTEE